MPGAGGARMSDAAWDVIKIAVQVLLVAGLGAVGHFLKKSLNGINARLESLEHLEREGAIGAATAEGRLREKLAAGYVSRGECNTCHDETRDTTTRLFSKVETLQQGQARMEGKVDAMVAITGDAFRALSARAAEEIPE